VDQSGYVCIWSGSVAHPWSKSWVLKLGSVNGSQEGGGEYGSGMLLKLSIMANKLICFLFLILRLGEARVTMNNAERGATKKC